jgi:hypothetical protein
VLNAGFEECTLNRRLSCRGFAIFDSMVIQQGLLDRGSRENRRRDPPWANLQPGIVAVTTTAATTSSASFLPTRPSPAIRDCSVMFSDIARGRSEVLG